MQIEAQKPITFANDRLIKLPGNKEIKKLLSQRSRMYTIEKNHPGLLLELQMSLSGETVSYDQLILRIDDAITNYLAYSQVQGKGLVGVSREDIVIAVTKALQLEEDFTNLVSRTASIIMKRGVARK